jgi:YggT family protein
MDVRGLFASLLDLYAFIMLVYVVLSWLVMASPSGVAMDLYRAMATICEPYLGLFRRFVPQITVGAGALDLSPLVGLLVLEIAANILRGR